MSQIGSHYFPGTVSTFKLQQVFFYGIPKNIDLCWKKHVVWKLADILFYQKLAYFFGNFNIDLPDCVHMSINVFHHSLNPHQNMNFNSLDPLLEYIFFIPNFGSRFHQMPPWKWNFLIQTACYVYAETVWRHFIWQKIALKKINMDMICGLYKWA